MPEAYETYDKNQMVRLRNGDTVPYFMVRVVELALAQLKKDQPIALYEAIMLARDPGHQPFGLTGEELANRNLIERNGDMHELVRSIIQSSVEGEQLDIKFVDPIVGPA